MRNVMIFSALLAAALQSGLARAEPTVAPENAQVYFIWPSTIIC